MFIFGRGKRKWFTIAVASLVCAAGVLVVLVVRRPNRTEDIVASLPLSFDGPSATSLRQTIIVPTLDTPVPEGKSAVWCASFQLAWDRLKNDVANGPVEVQNAEAVASRLNVGEQPETSLDPATFYAAAGLAKHGVVERIRAEMGERFPQTPIPELNTTPDGVVAYGYLKAGVRYRYPFFENDEPLTFTDSKGHRTRVKSFGIRKKEDYAYDRLREQVEILYCPKELIWRDQVVSEFVLDPCKHSSPHQLVLARLGRRATLALTLADAEQKIKQQPTTDLTPSLDVRDTLLVPGMHWRVQHSFKELEGKDKRLLNPPLRGLYLDTALQTIDFTMDRGGAEVASEAKMYVKPGASYFEFNRPFLLYMKKRGGDRPFFVLWAENAELLQGW
jgi:hypothetical protein